MSASNTPPNPNTPRKNPQAPNPSFLARRPGVIIAGIALAATSYIYLSRPPAPRDGPAGSLRTTGVQNIEKAYTNAGATPTHTKAYGGTKMGDKDMAELREGGGTGTPGQRSPFHKEGLGDEQRPGTETTVGQVFDKTNLGSHKGK